MDYPGSKYILFPRCQISLHSADSGGEGALDFMICAIDAQAALVLDIEWRDGSAACAGATDLAIGRLWSCSCCK